MSDSRYSKIFEDLKRDLFTVAKRHGKRALREAVRDAAHENLLQEEDDEQNTDGEVPPEDLDYPDEDVWTLPPAPEDDTEEDTDEDELSEAAERVLDRLMDRLKDKAQK